VKVIILSATEVQDLDSVDETTAIGIDDDDFGFVASGQAYVHSGYLKIDDIKGESSDSAGGNAETTWKVEEGEKASKPKEIVVVGSKTTDKATPKLLEASCGGTHVVCEPKNAVTPDGLTDFALRTVNSFESVNEIIMDDTQVEVKGNQPFKLFGFIPMNLKQTVSVSLDQDSFGRVKVKFPWYSFFGRKTVRSHDLMTDLEQGIMDTQFSKWKLMDFDGTQSDPGTGPAGEEIMADETQGTTGDRPTENITFNFNEVKAQLLDTISQTLVQYNESDLNFLNR
jgi:hypothetical protein